MKIKRKCRRVKKGKSIEQGQTCTQMVFQNVSTLPFHIETLWNITVWNIETNLNVGFLSQTLNAENFLILPVLPVWMKLR